MMRQRWRFLPVVPALVVGTAFAGEGPAALRLDLRADRPIYAVGQPVQLTLAVTNPGLAPISLTAPSSQLYDFAVLRDGSEVWRWSADKMFLTVLTQLTISPGETRTFTERWDQRDRDGRPVDPGHYEVLGILTGGEQVGLVPGRVRITIRS